jgi:hypothetical protein
LIRSVIVGEAERFSDAFWVHPTILKLTPTAAIIIMMVINP